MRTRAIKPGIATNEDLAKLGPESEILFTRLWMLADREGRLEDRPARIKARALPFYDWDVEKLLKGLAKAGFIQRYKVRVSSRDGGGMVWLSVIQVTNFRKHQWIHIRECASILPPKPLKNQRHVNSKAPAFPGKGPVRPGKDPCEARFRTALNIVTSNSSNNGVGEFEAHGVPAFQQSPLSPPLKTPDPEQIAAPGPPGVTRPRKPPARAKTSDRPPKQAGAIDFWPYSADDVAMLRETTASLAGLIHRQPPDDALLRQCLDACRGAPARDIREAIRALNNAGRFRAMRSWGLLPVLLTAQFKRYSCAKLA
jgi:hypothetical protein